MNPVPKPITWRDDAFRAWIREQPCLVAGLAGHVCRGKAQCAHLKTQGSRGPDRGNAVPLCDRAHKEQEGKSQDFCRKYELDLWTEARKYLARYLELSPDAPPETPAKRAHRPFKPRKLALQRLAGDRMTGPERALIEEIRDCGWDKLGAYLTPKKRKLLLAFADRVAPLPSSARAS